MDQMRFALIKALGLPKEAPRCACGNEKELKDGETRCDKCLKAEKDPIE